MQYFDMLDDEAVLEVIIDVMQCFDMLDDEAMC